MFAVIEIGGKQYKIEKGVKFDVEKIEEKDGNTIEINKVLLLNDNGNIQIGTPFINGAYASAKIIEQIKADKIIVFKMKAKKRYQKKQGHRQKLTTIEIIDIKATGGTHPELPKVKPVAKKPVVNKKPKVKKKTPVKPETKPAVKAAKPKITKAKTAVKKKIAKEA